MPSSASKVHGEVELDYTCISLSGQGVHPNCVNHEEIGMYELESLCGIRFPSPKGTAITVYTPYL